jgi:proteasome lid subunit RPN8/RPN11
VTFSPLAWLKFLLFLHAGDTEVGGFGISAEKQPLYIEDFQTVQQTCSAVTVAFDDTAVADYFDDCIDKGLTPARFARIWAHTHPGESPEPSSVDEETFQRVFGGCDWAIMLIVSRTHETYARLSFNAGPGGSILLPVQVDWAAWPQILLDLEEGAGLSAISEKWLNEYAANIHEAPIATSFGSGFDFTPSRESRTSHLFREDDIYARHDQIGLDDEFANYFETAGREER